MESLRTPEECFADLPGFGFEPQYATIDDLDGGTMRVHYLDEGPADAAPVTSTGWVNSCSGRSICTE